MTTPDFREEARNLVDEISVPLSEMRGQTRAADKVAVALKAAYEAGKEAGKKMSEGDGGRDAKKIRT